MPIVVRSNGLIVIELNELQFPNALAPILVTESGITIVGRTRHPLNALAPILRTVLVA